MWPVFSLLIRVVLRRFPTWCEKLLKDVYIVELMFVERLGEFGASSGLFPYERFLHRSGETGPFSIRAHVPLGPQVFADILFTHFR